MCVRLSIFMVSCSRFLLSYAQHHCRSCGKVVCAKCSPNTIHLGAHSKRTRVCVPCYRHLQLLHHSGDTTEGGNNSGKRLTLSAANNNNSLQNSTGSVDEAAAGGNSPSKLKHQQSHTLFEDRVLEARALFRAVRQARQSRRALLLRMQLAGARTGTETPLYKFVPTEVYLNTRGLALGEVRRPLCLHTNYRETLQVRNTSTRPLTLTWKLLEGHKWEAVEFSVNPRSVRLHEVCLFVRVGVRVCACGACAWSAGACAL